MTCRQFGTQIGKHVPSLDKPTCCRMKEYYIWEGLKFGAHQTIIGISMHFQCG